LLNPLRSRRDKLRIIKPRNAIDERLPLGIRQVREQDDRQIVGDIVGEAEGSGDTIPN
jgi:hypothetical protein